MQGDVAIDVLSAARSMRVLCSVLMTVSRVGYLDTFLCFDTEGVIDQVLHDG